MKDWKDDILQSLEGAQRAQPNPALYGKIQAKVASTIALKVVKRPTLAVAAACLTLLITANVWAISQSRVESRTPSVYQIESADFDIY